MNKILLITRPWYDDGTKYLYDYSLLVIKRAEAKNILFKDFKEKEANKENVEKFINKQNPKILFINGHGEEEILYGQNNQPIFSLENIKLLKDRFVYARACSAGIIFGKKMIEGNSGCFIGYNSLDFLTGL